MLGPRGLTGALRVELLTDWPEALTAGTELWQEGSATSWRLGKLETGDRVPVLHLDGITTREGAERLVGTYLEGAPRSLEAESYFWDDLIGLRVEGPGGEAIGELVEIFRAGGNEVYRVVGDHSERLVPALKTSISRIDIESGVMTLTADEPEEVT
ncbi:MAG TPA: ribosome maturation factor RimM [Candidatus Limnocylindria bacterium]